MSLLKQFGINLRKRRIAHNLSQESLALEGDLAMNYLSAIERGKANPSLRVIGRLAAALDIGIAELFEPIPDREVLAKTLRPGPLPAHSASRKKGAAKRARARRRR
jgi:transcriptional regulator with XRE-family HTH domain